MIGAEHAHARKFWRVWIAYRDDAAGESRTEDVVKRGSDRVAGLAGTDDEHSAAAMHGIVLRGDGDDVVHLVERHHSLGCGAGVSCG